MTVPAPSNPDAAAPSLTALSGEVSAALVSVLVSAALVSAADAPAAAVLPTLLPCPQAESEAIKTPAAVIQAAALIPAVLFITFSLFPRISGFVSEA